MGLFDIFQNKNSLKQKIKIIEEEMKEILLIIFNKKFSILHYGAYEIDPKYLVFQICVNTDKIKEKLEKDKELSNKLRNVLIINEYPKQSINNVYIGFESQETVNRESKGDWYLHFK